MQTLESNEELPIIRLFERDVRERLVPGVYGKTGLLKPILGVYVPSFFKGKRCPNVLLNNRGGALRVSLPGTSVRCNARAA